MCQISDLTQCSLGHQADDSLMGRLIAVCNKRGALNSGKAASGTQVPAVAESLKLSQPSMEAQSTPMDSAEPSLGPQRLLGSCAYPAEGPLISSKIQNTFMSENCEPQPWGLLCFWT